MQHRLRLLMGATALLYLGPLMAGLAGFGWALVPLFAAIFIAWLMVLRPQHWPRDLDGWTHGQAWVRLGTQGSVQLLLVAMLFGVGRGIGGAFGLTAPFPAALPVLVSALAIPLSRIIWNPNAAGADPLLNQAIRDIAHLQTPHDQGDMALARRLIAPLAGLPDDATLEEIARHLVAMSGHVEDSHIRAALLETLRDGTASRAQTTALVLHATDAVLNQRIGGDGPTLVFGHLPEDAELVRLFALRLTAALDLDPELWGQCPSVDLLSDTAARYDNTPTEAALRDLIEALNMAQPEDGLA